MKGSVIIPVYNQPEPLSLTLQAFDKQRLTGDDTFEVIVIDDGSQQDVRQILLKQTFHFSLRIVRQSNQGRASARNFGVEHAKHDTIIFCDADRIPGPDFVSRHLESHKNDPHCIAVGMVKEIYTAVPGQIQDVLFRRARTPQYQRLTYHIFDEKGLTDSGIPWIAFFTGNLSVQKEDFRSVKGFNRIFKKWGFEHFELGYRLFQQQLPFVYLNMAVNYHLAHKRDMAEMRNCFEQSLSLLHQLYPNEPIFTKFREFMFGNLSLQDFETNREAAWLSTTDRKLWFVMGNI